MPSMPSLPGMISGDEEKDDHNAAELSQYVLGRFGVHREHTELLNNVNFADIENRPRPIEVIDPFSTGAIAVDSKKKKSSKKR